MGGIGGGPTALHMARQMRAIELPLDRLWWKCITPLCEWWLDYSGFCAECTHDVVNRAYNRGACTHEE